MPNGDEIILKGTRPQAVYQGGNDYAVIRASAKINRYLSDRAGQGDKVNLSPPTYEDEQGVTRRMIYCSQCGDWKEQHEVYPDKNHASGFRRWCKAHDNQARVERRRRRSVEKSVPNS